MGLRNTEQSYGSMTKFIHWAIVIAVYAMIAIGYLQQEMKEGAFQDQMYDFHKALGLTILFVMAFRVIWRFTNVSPSLPSTVPTWQRFASRFVHLSLYACLFLMPITGWIMATASGNTPSFFGLFNLPMPGIPLNKPLAHTANEIHETVAIVLICAIVIHVAAAIKHHFVDKDNVLQRMLPNTKRQKVKEVNL